MNCFPCNSQLQIVDTTPNTKLACCALNKNTHHWTEDTSHWS